MDRSLPLAAAIGVAMLAAGTCAAARANGPSDQVAPMQSVHEDPNEASVSAPHIAPDADGRRIYIVMLRGDGVASAWRKKQDEIAAQLPPAQRRAVKWNPRSPEAQELLAQSQQRHQRVLGEIAALVHRRVEPVQDYHYAINGFSLNLTEPEAEAVRKMSEVQSVDLPKQNRLMNQPAK